MALIEDSPEYALLVREMLGAATDGPLEIAHFEDMNAALPHLRDQQVDCVLMDLGLPDTTGLGGLAQVQSVAPDLPIVVLSGEQSEEIAVQAVHEGAQDYLVKRSATGEHVLRSVRYAMERKRAQVALAHQALHDSLTGLPNRTLLMDRTDQALARAERTQGRVALLFLDLDRFKLVNDSLGHDAGDRLLCRVAERLKSLIRPSDTVARFGGDEFMVLCDRVEDDRQAILVAERLSGGLAEPFVLEGRELFVGASIGIAFGADRSATAVSLIRDADQAMYRAKERGSRYEMADGTASRRAAVRLSTETQLHRALDRKELRLFFQPEVDLIRNSIFSVEALLRWQHPDRGMLGPGDFLSSAEENGLIVPIGEWVIDTAATQLAGWRNAGLCAPDMSTSINLSLRQLAEPGLLETVQGAIERAGIPPEALCFEITESVVAADEAEVMRHLGQLRELGVGLSLDDFGVGLSSLSALDRYPLDMLKIDRSFVGRLASGGERAERMFSAVLGAARAVGLKAVAEGIETRSQLETVKRLGCDAAQGFYLCRPEAAGTLSPRLLSLTPSAVA
ncbi:MAG TPA: EAL domain-containing protein [Thermoleophilaceae bacterium]|nr:EAL domain-containing protein [Thermoleophilaceae bacterium]